jgi:uncharacterized protein involved in exopolysaccharide biosynthesis
MTLLAPLTNPTAEAVISAVLVSLIGPAVLKWFGARLQDRRSVSERKLSMEQQFREAEFARAERIQVSREEDYQRLRKRVEELEAKVEGLEREVERLRPYEVKVAELERRESTVTPRYPSA